METKFVSVEREKTFAFEKRIKERQMSSEEWIETHGSGTLRKNKRIGFAWQKQYMHERIAYEFGFIFEMIPKTRVTFNDPISEGDCHPVTEADWHIERYMTLSVFSEDIFEAKYIIIEETDGKRREGIGIIVKQTSFQIPAGNVVFAIVAEFDNKAKGFLPVRNPF